MIYSETPPEISKKKNTHSNLQHERKRRRRRRRTFSSSHCVSVLGCCILVYFIGNHHLWGGKPCPILYWPDPFVAKVIKIPLFAVIGHAASITLTSLFCVRKNEFEHSRHSGDKCLPEYDIRTNEDSVRISRKHRGTKTVSTGVSICLIFVKRCCVACARPNKASHVE